MSLVVTGDTEESQSERGEALRIRYMAGGGTTVPATARVATRPLLYRSHGDENRLMRALVALLVACAVVFGVYHFYFRKMPVTDEGTAPTQAISLTGVRSDLLQIGQAERAFIAENGKCATLDELISSRTLAMERKERDGYAYSVECAGGSFSATGRHAPAAADSPIRYPTLAIDQTMQVREVN